MAEFREHAPHPIVSPLDPLIIHFVHSGLLQDSDSLEFTLVQDSGTDLSQRTCVADTVPGRSLPTANSALVEHWDELIRSDLVQTCNENEETIAVYNTRILCRYKYAHYDLKMNYITGTVQVYKHGKTCIISLCQNICFSQ